jgi:uncharacterized protein YutE (UPF0331/DUF86 family)
MSLIPQANFEHFSSDFRNVAATLYLLQTSNQALVDLAAWLVRRRALGTPRTVEIGQRSLMAVRM